MWETWSGVFRKHLWDIRSGPSSANCAEVRNRWSTRLPLAATTPTAPPGQHRAHFHRRFRARSQEHKEEQKMALRGCALTKQRRGELRKQAVALLKALPAIGLQPWREVVTRTATWPVANTSRPSSRRICGRSIYARRRPEYQNPTEFFRRTFITEGLQSCFRVNAVQRLGGQGAIPVVELQTNFGGGKTHSMLALYHLFSGTPVSGFPAWTNSSSKRGLPSRPTCAEPWSWAQSFAGQSVRQGGRNHRAHHLGAKSPWQLGGKDGYGMIRADDETAIPAIR